MSSIPTKHIDGDTAIGRNVTAGGNADIKGDVHVGHHLRVDGWLDAPNIKGANKGLFATGEALERSYPTPRPGWWAMVGDCIPAQIYIAAEGKWHATGNYVEQVDIPSDGWTEELRDALYALISEHTEDVAHLEGLIENRVTVLRTTLDNLIGGNASEAIDSINEILAFLEGFSDTEKLAGKLDEIRREVAAVTKALASVAVAIDFAGTVSGVSVTAGGLGRVPSLAAHNAGAASVVFDTGGKRFLLRVGAPISDPPAYYSEWAAAGTGAGALRPYTDYSAGKLFRDTTAGKLYAWDGTGTLRLLGDLSDILAAIASDAAEIGFLQSRTSRHEECLGDLVYKTGELRTATDANASAITGNTGAIAALAARLAYLEEYGGVGGGDPSACGCRPLTAADIDSVFDGEPEEPDGPADAEPVTAAQIDDLLDDGMAQTPVESPPGDDRLDEEVIDALINGIFG